jgi:hypothetical protein
LAYSANRPSESGAHTDIGMTKARGARHVGLIWMLIASTVAAIVVVFGLWALESGHLGSSDTRNGAAAVSTAKAAQFHTPG